MKTIHRWFVLPVLFLSGCVTRPDSPPPAPGQLTEEFLLIARPLAEGFATAALANNPKYAPFVCGIADGLALALQQTELTPAMVDRFTTELRRQHLEVNAQTYALARSFLLGLYATWRLRFGPLQPADPGAQRVLTEIGSVLRNACTAVAPAAP